MATKSIRLSDGTDTLLPESGITGSNSNGYYSKFADGTLIQWGSITPTLTLTQIGSSGIYTATTTVTFPQAFDNARYYAYGTSRYGTGHAVSVGAIQSGAGYMTISIYDFYARSGTINVTWCAIGRWK